MRSSRRSRSKARKPRYVSLRQHLAPPRLPSPPLADPSDMSSSAAADDGDEVDRRRHRLRLFPLHPDHLDRDPHVACLLDDRGGGGDPTLAALLFSSSSRSPSPPSLASPWAAEDGDGGDRDGLARRALRGRERWAYLAAPAADAAASSEEEVASSAARDCSGGVDLCRCAAAMRKLALKLDYEEILAAWSDRGPLFMDGDGPQVVPQLHHHIDDPRDPAAFPTLVEIGSSGAASAWKVPEGPWDGDRTEGKEESSSIISREERVRRYKEKRRNRLFAKTIRYEVRKMNAEKRPRAKGRFVRRKDDEQDH